MSDSPIDQLRREYGKIFRDFDDLTLARWLSQTLGQLQGRVWRNSHPLILAYGLAAHAGNDRQIWHKRLTAIPLGYVESNCCGSPLLPLFTRDILECGLVCHHCGGTAVEFDDLPGDLREEIRSWAKEYSTLHHVAHWDHEEQQRVDDYDEAYEEAAEAAEKLLAAAGNELVPRLGQHYHTIVWEDADECLEVRPEDIVL